MGFVGRAFNVDDALGWVSGAIPSTEWLSLRPVFAGYVAAMFGLASIPKSPTAEVSSIESTAAAN